MEQIETGREAPLLCQARILAIDEGRRRIEHVVSTGRLDRGGRIVEPGGWDLKQFKAAPRVLADHSMTIERVIGKAINTRVTEVAGVGDALVSTTEFDKEGLGAVGFRLVQTGLVNSWSAGWLGTKRHRIGEVEDCEGCKAVAGQVEYGTHFVEQELLEYSLVAVGSNPDAVNGLRVAGLVSNEAAEEWMDVVHAVQQTEPVQPVRTLAFIQQLNSAARIEKIRAASKQRAAIFRRRVSVK